MTGSEFGTTVHVPVVVGTVGARGPRFVKRVVVAVFGAVVIGGFAAALMPWGMTWPWLAALCAAVGLSSFAVGLHSDVRSVGVLGLALAPTRRLLLRGTWTTRTYDLTEVVAVQVWCDCGGTRRGVAPHRDGMEVFFRDGRVVRVESTTAFAADVAVTLGELLVPDGVKVVDWGEIGAVAA